MVCISVTGPSLFLTIIILRDRGKRIGAFRAHEGLFRLVYVVLEDEAVGRVMEFRYR